MLSAILYVGKDGFTGNELAAILREKFALPKTTFKAQSFAYQQLQSLIKKGVITKKRKKGANQYVYGKTKHFESRLEKVKLIQPLTLRSYYCSSKVEEDTCSNFVINRDENLKLKIILHQYEAKLAQLIGEKEVYEDFLFEFPAYEKEFKNLSNEVNKKVNMLIGKIGALERVIDRISDAR